MSLDVQAETGRKRAKELSFNHILWNEGGKSSNHEEIDKRPILSQVYNKIVSGEIKHLFVYDQSRLSRQDSVSSAFRVACSRNGVTLYTKDSTYELANPSDQFFKSVMDALAQLDNAQRAERTRLGKLARVKQGYWMGGPPPFGYKILDKKLVINTEEKIWVKKIFTETTRGTSTLDVKKMLDSNGVLPRRRANTWSIGSVQALLKNTHYKGIYNFQDKKSGEKIETVCPAIVDVETWTAVQKLKTRTTSRVSQQNRTKQFYLLRDLMICGHCGLPISARRMESKNEQLYYCPNKERDWVKKGGSDTPWERDKGCGMSRSLNISETDRLVWDAVIDTHKNSTILKEEVKWKILEEAGAPLARDQEDIKFLERQLKQLDRMLKQQKESQANLLLGQNSGEIKADVYKIALEKSSDKIHNLEIKIANIKLQIKGGNENKKWVDWLKIFGQNLEKKKTLSDIEKQQYLMGLIEKISVKYDKDKNQHEVVIKFQLPVVGDSVIWKNPENHKEGYKVKKGKLIKGVVVKKKDPRWSKVTPQRNDSVTVE
jgi:DNA invertase Pin-like site-specific DNA recombinase